MQFIKVNPRPTVSHNHGAVQFKRSISFLNYSGESIKVTYPNREYVNIPAIVESMQRGYVDILVDYDVYHGTSLYSLKDQIDKKEYEIVSSQLSSGVNSFQLTYRVDDISTLFEGNGIYVEVLGLSLMTATTPGWKYPEFDLRAASEHEATLSLKIVVVDSCNMLEGHWLRMLDLVMPIRRSTRTALPDGIYMMVTTTEDQQVRRYELLEDIKPFNLYPTQQTALDAADDRSQIELLQLERDRLAFAKVEAERENLRIKSELEQQKLLDDTRAKRLQYEHEEERRDAERKHKDAEYHRKEHFESRSSIRKDTSEGLKWLPAIIGAAGVVFGLMV